MNLPSNTPPDREGSSRRQWPAERRPEAPEIDWPALVRRCLDGDSSAWTELVAAQQRRVYALCYRFTASSHDAEDLTQDVFIKLYGNLASFDAGQGQLPDLDHHPDPQPAGRSFPPFPPAAGDGLDGRRLGAGQRRPPAWTPSSTSAPRPLQHAVRNQLEQMVQNALAKVSPELREAVILRDLQDMDYKEIAEVLAIPQGTVKSRISRGRAELARLLERTKGQVM